MFAEVGQFSLQSASSYLVHEQTMKIVSFTNSICIFQKIHLKSMFLVMYCQSVKNKDSLKWSGNRINGT